MEIGHILTTLLLVGCFYSIVVIGEKCLRTEYHKEAPSPESNFQECTSWEKNSCCNITISNTIHSHGLTAWYNLHYDKCGTLSAACEKFMIDDFCFFSCEPKLIEFQVMGAENEWPFPESIIENVPICSSLCDKWFEACKDDNTCVEDFLEDWHYHPDTGENHCPNGSECITYTEMYKDGKGLCDKFWGKSYYYEKSDNCMVMKFDPSGENPNSKVIIRSAAESVMMTGTNTRIGNIIVFLVLGIFSLNYNN